MPLTSQQASRFRTWLTRRLPWLMALRTVWSPKTPTRVWPWATPVKGLRVGVAALRGGVRRQRTGRSSGKQRDDVAVQPGDRAFEMGARALLSRSGRRGGAAQHCRGPARRAGGRDGCADRTPVAGANMLSRSPGVRSNRAMPCCHQRGWDRRTFHGLRRPAVSQELVPETHSVRTTSTHDLRSPAAAASIRTARPAATRATSSCSPTGSDRGAATVSQQKLRRLGSVTLPCGAVPQFLSAGLGDGALRYRAGRWASCLGRGVAGGCGVCTEGPSVGTGSRNFSRHELARPSYLAVA